MAKSESKVYSLGLTSQNCEVIWKDGVIYEGDGSVYRASPVHFCKTSLAELSRPMHMSRITCAGAQLLQSKVVDGKVVSSGVDLADEWVRQNGGKFVPFDSSQFTIVRSKKEYENVCDFRYIGSEDVHVNIPDGVRIVDRMFSDRHIKSCSIPDSVESAYDMFRYGTYDKMPYGSVKNAPYYLFRNSNLNTEGWVLPENSCLLAHATEQMTNYDDRDCHPVVWYKRGGEIHEYCPLRHDAVLSEDEAAVRMCSYIGNPDSKCCVSAEGLRVISDSRCDLEDMSDIRDFIRINICEMKGGVGRSLYKFDSPYSADFGDLTISIYSLGNTYSLNDCYAQWMPEGYNRDGTNLYGDDFDIPEGVLNIDMLFYDDEVLSKGVVIPASTVSAYGTYERSDIESMPDFKPDSRLEEMSRICCGCSRLSSIPSPPPGVKTCDNAFADTGWANDMPIENAKGADILASCARETMDVQYGEEASTSRLYEIT